MKDAKDTGLGGFRWLNLCQFGGALNDNFLKLVIIYALGVWWTGKDGKEVLGLVGIAFAVPFLLFLGLGGNLADRCSKAQIAQWTKFLEVVIALAALAAFWFESVWGVFAVAFMMSTQSALFSPAKYGIIPELVGQTGIAKANGYIQAATYLAIIGGTLLAPAASSLTNRNYVLLGLIALAIAIAGWVFSLGLPRTPKGRCQRAPNPLVIPDVIRTLKYVHKDGFLTLAVWGSAYFAFVAGFAQLNLLSYGTEHLQLESKEMATSLFLFIALGIGAGSLLAGWASRKSIEFGIVPIGTLMLAAGSLCLGFIPEGSYLVAGITCAVMGIGAGLFIVPIDSFIQFRTAADRRGEVIAVAGWLAWAGILLAAILIYVLPHMGMQAADGFILMGVLLTALFSLAMWLLPDFFVRFLAMILTRVYFRLKVGGNENVPGDGAALIVANHASLMDAAFLLASQPRRIRFLMEREYIESSPAIMRGIFRLMGVIPVSKKGSPKDIVRALKEARQALEEGWLVGIFPEGTLSRTGHMLPFKRGYQSVIKGTGAVIIPSYIDGAYGLQASYVNKSPRPLALTDFRKTIGLVFGPQVGEDIAPEDLEEVVRGLADDASILRLGAHGSVGNQFIRSCRTHWNKLAVTDSSGKRLSYGHLLSASVAMTSQLEGKIPTERKIVGVILPPTVAAIVVNSALTLGRKISANLNYTSSPEALTSCMEKAGIETIVTSRTFLEKSGVMLPAEKCLFVEDLAGDIGPIKKVAAWLMARFLPAEMLSSQEGWSPDETLTVLFSSGSTATPKGVMLSHRNVASNIEAFSSVARVQDDDLVLGVLPLFHSMGYTTTFWFPMLKGISACYHHHPLECDKIEALSKGVGVSIVIGTPTFMLAWARKISPEAWPNLRWVCAGAEKMRPKMADLFKKRFGVRPMEGYGATECSPVISVNVPDVDVDGVFQRGFKEGSAGRPLPNLNSKVVDPGTGEKLPRGTAGLLLLKGPSIMRGYLDDPRKTQEVLTEGWYNTGDIAIVDKEGFITITDRLSRFSKIGGEMVSHTAVEEAIRTAAAELIGTKSTGFVVTGVPDEKKGERLVVLYEPDLGDLARIQEKVAGSDIPNLWKPSPKNWIPVEKIPVLGTGKLDLKAVKAAATAQE